MNPRKPTKEEKKQLLEFILRDEDPEMYDAGKVDPEHKGDMREAIDAAAIAIFDHYITDSVGYAGKVMVVVWPVAPGATQTYTWYEAAGKEYLSEEPNYQVKW
jgi:hypothetical protein